MGIKRNKLILISIILIVFSVLAGCTSEKELAAKVNDVGITKVNVEENFNIKKMVIESLYGTDIWTMEIDGRIYEDLVREGVLETLIREALLKEELQKLEIEVLEEEVEEQLNEMKTNTGEENFKSILEHYNVTEENMKDVFRGDIIVQKYKENFYSQLDITDEDLRTLFNENKDDFIKVKAMHILVNTEEEAMQVIEELNEGKDFGELAQEKSIDPSAVQNSGELDYFKKGQMVQEFEEASFSLEVGKISEPVETEYGFHVIKVVDRLDQFEDLKDEVTIAYKESKFNEKIEELKSESNIEIYTDNE